MASPWTRTQVKLEYWSQIPKDVKTKCEIRPKCTIQEQFLGFLRFLEVKVMLDVETRNIYELNFFPTHQNKQILLEKVLPKFFGLGDSQFW